MAQKKDDYTFGGRVIWGITPASPYTDKLHKALKERFEADVPGLDSEQLQAVNMLLTPLSLTETVDFHFDGKERKMLRQFKENWEKLPQMNTEQLGEFLYRLPYGMQSAWFAAVNNEQIPFEVPLAQMPSEMLSDADREALKDPASPLP